MSLQFSRSLRALRVDSFRPSRFAMFLAILLMGGLIAWFFTAKVTLYENSASLQFSEDGRLLATFTPEGMKRVRQGQTAMLHIDAGTDQPAETLPAMVFDTQVDSNVAEILVKSNEVPESLKTGNLSGHVEIEVEYTTPAQLLLRVSGKYFGGNNITVSPQSTQPVSQDGQ
jgi:hypothetical protein